jgi:uncharacterized membrane protein YcaP (DUF421 family)
MAAITFEKAVRQCGAAMLYYIGLLLITRFAGKRLAGQTTNVDLIVLIAMGVVLQNAALADGNVNAVIFVVTVFCCHKLIAYASRRSDAIRHVVRGKPRQLVRDGQLMHDALRKEGISEAEVLAGLRKLGHDGLQDVQSATLEVTGHVSAVARGATKDHSR